MDETDFYKMIVRMRAVRHFLDQAVPEDALTRILQAGRWAGSSKNVQPWQFVVVEQRASLQALSQCGRFGAHLAGAAVGIVLVMEPNYISGFDAGRTAQNMMLAAWSMGIGSCIASMHDETRAKTILGIPVEMQVPVAISFGYPDPQAGDSISGLPRKSVLGATGRKPLKDLVHREQW